MGYDGAICFNGRAWTFRLPTLLKQSLQRQKTCAGSRPRRLQAEAEFGPERQVLPEMLSEELWRAAAAGTGGVEQGPSLTEALETIGARDNFGLDPGKTGQDGSQREMFWRALHLGELAIARGMRAGRESAWRRFLAQYRGTADESRVR